MQLMRIQPSSIPGDKAEIPMALPPPPPIPLNVVPIRATAQSEKPRRLPMARPGLGRRGRLIQLETNHFHVRVANLEGYFYHYSVSFTYQDGTLAEVKGIGRNILDRVYDTYAASELKGKTFAYDGETNLYTVGPLPNNRFDFTVVVEDILSGKGGRHGFEDEDEGDQKRLRRPYQSKTYGVVITYAAKIPMKALASVFRGQESEKSQDARRVLDIILRQNAAKKGCLLVRQSFFHPDSRNYFNLEGGVLGCRGFHSSFRATQEGLSLNMDVSSTLIINPGPVVKFLLDNQNVKNPAEIDWLKAKRSLKNLRIRTVHSNLEYKITGISEFSCEQQRFPLRQRKGDGPPESSEVTVGHYFVNILKITLNYSQQYPCLNVGKPKRPVYIPLELCDLIPLQRYTKALSTFQRSKLVENARQRPQDRTRALSEALRRSNYSADEMLRASGVEIESGFTRVNGRVLDAPMLRFGNTMNFSPQDGKWNFNRKQLVEPVKIKRWAIVNFSARCNVREIGEGLIHCGKDKGLLIENPGYVFEEKREDNRMPPLDRVTKMIQLMKQQIPNKPGPEFILCILPEKKTSPLYGPWKKACLSDNGVPTQCVAPTGKVTDQYLTNVILKINAKLGGLNSMLVVERNNSIPLISKIPTLILGMDVSHGTAGQSDVPSIAAVVGSRNWPMISRYMACVRAQTSKVEMIDSLFQKESDGKDKGIIRELLLEFYQSSKKTKPQHIIIFRDGVSESQFSQILNIELDQIIQACKFMDEIWEPQFTVIVAQKIHHTKFFLPNSSNNVPPGTVIDNTICHPHNNDFYMCAHAGRIGTTRPTHYHVLYDEIGFSVDDVQELVHSLSYVYQRSTTAVSVVAPVCYAHLAASQVSQFVKFDDTVTITSDGSVSVTALPRLKDNVKSSMFFC